jgi:hypothetical protein
MRLIYASVLIVGLAVLSSCSKQGVDLDKVKKDFTAEMDAISGAEGKAFGYYSRRCRDGDKAKNTIKGVKFFVPADPFVIGTSRCMPCRGRRPIRHHRWKGPEQVQLKAREFGIDIGSQSWAGLLSTKYHASCPPISYGASR